MPKTTETNEIELVESLRRVTRDETDAERDYRLSTEAEIRGNMRTLNPAKNRFVSRNRITIELEGGDGITLFLKSIPGHIETKLREQRAFDVIEVPQKEAADGSGLVDDRSHPDYPEAVKKLNESLHNYSYRKMLAGLDMDLMSADGADLVWSHNGSVRREEDAIKALKALEIPEAQMTKIINEIDRLSGVVFQETQAEQEKKS